MFSKKLVSLPVETKPAMSEDKDIIKELTSGIPVLEQGQGHQQR